MVPAVAGRPLRPDSPRYCWLIVLVTVVAVVRIHPHALEMRIHDEVDHARDGVGAVHGGCAAGQHVDALNHGRGNLVDVRDVAEVPKPPPGAMRVPLMSTKVRCEPKPRKLTVAVPLELID